VPIKIDEIVLRKLEPRDVDSLFRFRNDPELKELLVGFSNGYAQGDLLEWLEYHRTRTDEVLYAIADTSTDECIGHIGLYQIDPRVRKAEFGLLIGVEKYRNRGIGVKTTRWMVNYGFAELNLNRIGLEVLVTNPRAIKLYEKVGFKYEGTLRSAQYRGGRYVDVQLMAILASDVHKQ